MKEQILANLMSLVAGYAHDRHAITIEELETLEKVAETMDELEVFVEDDLDYLRKLEEYPDCDGGDWDE